MLSRMLGSMWPVFGSMAYRTVQSKPCRVARIFASCDSASSLRYSSSPLTSTTFFPLPGPSPPGTTSVVDWGVLESAPATAVENRRQQAIAARRDAGMGKGSGKG